MSQTIPSHIFKSYDIRAIYPEEINKDTVYQIAQSVLAYMQEKLGKKNISIVVGHDMRLSAPELYPVMKKALVDGGAQIIDVDLLSTPTLYFAVPYLKVDAGIELTASHNPPEWNGMKMVLRDGDKVIKIGSGSGMEEIKENAAQGIVLQEEGGSEKAHSGILEEEVLHALELFPVSGIKPFKIVVDTANSMGATYIEELFKHVSADVVKMNFELDGTFPAHEPNPLVYENLKGLRERVIQEKADFGIATDGDGDRAFFIDENGEVVPPSFVTAMIAQELLKKNPGGKILFDIRYIMTPQRVIEEAGGTTGITKVGHAYITRDLNSMGAIFGGESSGHYFYKHVGGGESQVLTILIMLKVLSESNKKMSEMVELTRKSYESGESNFKTDKAMEIREALKAKYPEAQIDEMDGVSLHFGNWRCNVRTSNTEPLMRLNVEAETEQLMKEKTEEIKSFIINSGAEPHDH